VGGGVAGASISRVLARSGVGVTMLEKAGQLCAGATWHAAGLVTRFGGSPKIKKVHVHALRLMTQMHEEHDVGLHITGSIRLIEKGNADRLVEAKQHLAMAALYDDPSLPTQLVSAEEVKALHPLVDVSGIECGLYTPRDGDVDPTLLTTCIAKLAQADGAMLRFNAEVEHISKRQDGGFDVKLAGSGEPLTADVVVNAAGLWSRKFSNQLGMAHPAFVIEHQYAVTETLPQLKGMVGDGQRVPVLRDLRGSSYIRQERDGLLVGPYEEEVIVHTEWPEGPPSHFAFDLFPPALDRLESCLLSAMEVVPALETVGFKSVVNGPTIWTGDSLARCGRTRVPGYYDFNSLTYGVAQGLALSEYLGHIITEGEQPYDMATEFDPLRYSGWATPEYTIAKVTETYSHNNSISYPYENRPAGRQNTAALAAHSALYEQLTARGAVFSFSNAGVEVPMCFAPPGAAPFDFKTFHSHQWAACAEAEAAHLLRAVGIGFSSFSKLSVRSGTTDAASKLLEYTTTNTLPKKVGRTRLSYVPTRAGKLLGEFTITRDGVDGEHDFYLVGVRDYAQHDLAWLEQQRDEMLALGVLSAAEAAAIELVDDTNAVEILHICGPHAHQLMGALSADPPESIPFLQMRRTRVCDVAARVFHISFTGEDGYELHVNVDDVAPLWKAIWDHPLSTELGLRPFGGMAVNSLRIEKGFKVKADLDYAHWSEAGIGQFVPAARKNESARFLGHDAPTPADAAPRIAAIFAVDTSAEHAWSVPGDSPIRNAQDELVGFTTTSAKGAVTQRTIAMGYIKCADDGQPLASAGEAGLTVECYGFRWPVELLEKPPVAMGGPVKKDEPLRAATG